MCLLIEAVATLYEIIQFLSSVFDHVLVELHSVVHTEGPWEKNKKTGTTLSLNE